MVNESFGTSSQTPPGIYIKITSDFKLSIFFLKKLRFTDDKSIENIQQLFAEFKKFLVLQKEYTKLELTEKLTILLSTLIMILVLTILGMVALFYLLFALAYILEPLVGGLMVSFGIIASINVLLIAIIYFFRRQLIISPMVNFLANLFLNDSNKK